MRLDRMFIALLAGVLFGFGLALGGMLDPSVIRGFLDLLGDFDPRLAFVFAGAVIVSAIGTLLSRRMRQPVLSETFALSTNRAIDAPLIVGSGIFGLGWGMSGLCPGPAVAGLTLGVPAIALFTGSMLIGMGSFDLVSRWPHHGEDAEAARV